MLLKMSCLNTFQQLSNKIAKRTKFIHAAALCIISKEELLAARDTKYRMTVKGQLIASRH
jgi:hypothetical protein